MNIKLISFAISYLLDVNNQLLDLWLFHAYFAN